MSSPKISQPFGLWDSPISPARLGRGIGFSDVAWAESGALVWRENRSDRGVLVIQSPDGQAERDLTSDLSVRAGVGYGGGDFSVGQDFVYFVEAVSGRIYRQPLVSGTAKPITPAYGKAAAPTPSPDGRWVMYVHTYEDQDILAIVDVEGKQWPARLVSGDDFYMQPCWHPDGKLIAWVDWNFPNMPWDGTFLRMGRLEISAHGMPALVETDTLAGDEDTSIFQPQYSPDGRWLAYVSDQTGWWQLHMYDLKKKVHHQITRAKAEHGSPAWIQGSRNYGFSPNGHHLYFIRNQNGQESLWQIDLATGKENAIQIRPYTSLIQIATTRKERQIALIASASTTPAHILTTDPDGNIRIRRRSTPEDIPISEYSDAEHITWAGHDNGKVYGLYYAPQNESFEGVGLPPLLVMVHGGPTSQRLASFNPGVQFFTSRGYAVLDVNYRGSTGYGRQYRNKLRSCWGIYDVEDSVSGAEHLVDQKLVDGKRVIIMGASAGGFTVLKALEDYPGFFKAGICLYGVSNQFTSAAETHKFERRYSDTLLGPLPQAAEIYRQRSPIFFVDKISDPIIIFQGEEDMVVPRAQSDEVVASLSRRSVPCEYHLYPGEGHGFRKTETIEHMYTAIDKFLRQYVIFS